MTYENAIAHTTAEEQQYMSKPKKNYKWYIVIATILVIAGAAWYFYKH